jgi:hypothetical protein
MMKEKTGIRRVVMSCLVAVIVLAAMGTLALVALRPNEMPGGWGDIIRGMTKVEVERHLGVPGRRIAIINGAALDGSLYALCNLPDRVSLPGSEAWTYRAFDELLLVFFNGVHGVTATFWCRAGMKPGSWIIH